MERVGGALALSALLCLTLAACGKTSDENAKTSAATGSSSAASKCGTVPALGFKDQSGVIDGLGAEYKAAYNGYANPVQASPWASLKPKGSGPYTVGVTVTQPISPYQGALIPALQKRLKAVDGVGKVTVLTSGPTALPTQLQHINQLIQQKVDLIVAEPLAGPPFAKLVDAAAKAGIPVISLINPIPSKNAINLAPNSVGDGAASGAALAKMVGDKGTVLGVHAVRSTSVDQQSFAGWKAALDLCPNIKLDDSVEGQFQPAVAKAQVLSYLTSHPQAVAGVVQTAGMTPGVIQAFQQAGRPVPAMVDAGPSVGSLAYWKDHQPAYKATAFSIPADGLAVAAADVVTRVMSGHGPKVSDLVQLSPTYPGDGLKAMLPAGAKETEPTFAEPPGEFLSSSYLDAL